MKRMAFIVGLVVAAGCSQKFAHLSCEDLKDPGNCWATAAAGAAACLPMRTTVGAIAADRMSCDWPDGSSVRFDEPLPATFAELDHLNVTFIATDGSTCGTFEDAFQSHLELHAGGEDVVAEVVTNDLQVECDGTTFVTATSLTTVCTEGSVPTDNIVLTNTSFKLTIQSISTPGPLFECQ